MYKWMVEETQVCIGLNLIGLHKFDEAIEHFSEQIEDNPNEDTFYFWRGYAHRQAGLSQQINMDSYYYYEYHRSRKNTPESIKHFSLSIKDYNKAIKIHEKG